MASLPIFSFILRCAAGNRGHSRLTGGSDLIQIAVPFPLVWTGGIKSTRLSDSLGLARCGNALEGSPLGPKGFQVPLPMAAQPANIANIAFGSYTAVQKYRPFGARKRKKRAAWFHATSHAYPLDMLYSLQRAIEAVGSLHESLLGRGQVPRQVPALPPSTVQGTPGALDFRQ